MFVCYFYSPAEGRPDRTGLRMSNEIAALGIPVKVLIDSAVAYSMDEVDMIFVGADGVVESGGIINMMGTYQIALVAHSMNKPLYVAAESYKVLPAMIAHRFFLLQFSSACFPMLLTLIEINERKLLNT
jgi:translation initiation factor 2B subunit (eIF-2B alpha/beta/delta family)